MAGWQRRGVWTRRWGALAAALLVAPWLAAAPCPAGAGDGDAATGEAPGTAVGNYFAHWFDRVSRTQAEQPHWVTPLVTVTPRLEEEYRYDQFWQSRARNQSFESYGAGKGLELIPTEHTEIILGVPAYQERSRPNAASGWADDNLLLKYRMLSANEQHGDYILSLFLGAAVPSGSAAFTTHQTVLTPAVAFGKGWGDFDLQGTLGVALPDGQRDKLGTPYTANAALQYHLLKYCWPECEVNYTYWPTGERAGINQVFLTPAVALGRLPLGERVGLTLVTGLQIAVAPDAVYHNNIVLSARVPF